MRCRVNISNPPLVERYLKKSISLINKDRSFNGDKYFIFNQYLYALSYRIQIPMDDLNLYQKNRVIYDAILRTFDSGKINLPEFEKNLQAECDIILKTPKLKFFAAIPVKIPYKSINKRVFKILETKISVSSSENAMRKFDFKSKKITAILPDMPIIHTCYDKKISYFIFEGDSRNFYEFYESSIKNFELFRAIINFAENYRTTQFFGYSTSISFIKKPQIAFMFDENHQFLAVESTSNDTSLHDVDMMRFKRRKVMENNIHLLQKINAIHDKKLQNVFILALEIHNSALDNIDKEWLCCFKFWQILERLVLADQNLKYDEICKRLIPFLGEIEPFYDMIQLYSKKRHNYVHNANIYEFSNLDVEIMKDMSEFLLYSLLIKSGKLADFDSLKRYYQSIDFYFKNVDLTNKKSLQTMAKQKLGLHHFERSKFFKKIQA